MHHNKERCLRCLTIPIDVLVLACNHTLCLPCSSKQIEKQTNQKQYSILCGICQQKTEVEQQIYNELIKLGKSYCQQQRPPIFKGHQIMNGLQDNLRFRQSKQVRQNLNNGQDFSIEKTCSFHPQYTLIYLCKTCSDVLICPECVINGNHKNHEVASIQKEGEKIKNILQNQLNTVNIKVNSLEALKNTKIGKNQQNCQQLQILRASAKQQYQAIRDAINRQQQAVISKCNELISLHKKEQQIIKTDINNQLLAYENQRLNIIQMLSSLMQESAIGKSKSIQKALIINLIQQFKHYRIRHTKEPVLFHNNQQNYCNNRQVIKALSQRVAAITIDAVKLNQNGSRKSQNISIMQNQMVKKEPILIRDCARKVQPARKQFFRLM